MATKNTNILIWKDAEAVSVAAAHFFIEACQHLLHVGGNFFRQAFNLLVDLAVNFFNFCINV